MHAAVFETLPLTRTDFRISSAASYGDRLFVGGTDGALRVFRSLPGTDPRVSFQLESPKFSPDKRPVQRLTCVPEWGLLLSYSDAGVAVHRLSTLDLVQLVPKTKECTTFTVSFNPAQLYVSARKKIRIYSWNPVTSSFLNITDYEVPDEVYTLEWMSGRLLCGSKKEFYVLLPKTGAPRTLFPVDAAAAGGATPPALRLTCILRKVAEALANSLSDSDEEEDHSAEPGTEAIICLPRRPVGTSSYAAQGYLVDMAGRPTRSNECISWEECPIALAAPQEFPYVLSALSKRVEVHNTVTTAISQVIPIPNVQSIHKYYPATSDGRRAADSDSKSAAGAPAVVPLSNKGEHLILVCPMEIIVLRMVPLVMQVAALVSQRPARYQEALALADQCRSMGGISEDRIHQLRSDYGFDLFSRSEFDEALEMLYEANTPAKQVLSLFSELLPQGVHLSQSYPVHMPVLTGAALADALHALIPYLEKVRIRLGNDTGLVHEDLESDDGEGEDDDARPANSVKLPTQVLVDTVLVAAYLLQERGVHPTASDSDGEALISGGRSRAEREDDHKNASADLMRLLESPNCCYMEECESRLKHARKWQELTVLYRAKGQHRKALELLASRFQSSSSSSRQRRRLRAFSSYLSTLGRANQRLVFEFVSILLSIPSSDDDPFALSDAAQQGMDVLRTRALNGSPELEPEATLAFLKSDGIGVSDLSPSAVQPALAEVSKGVRRLWNGPVLCIEYLEFLVQQCGDASPARHGELVTFYLQVITPLLARSKTEQQQRRERRHSRSSGPRSPLPVAPKPAAPRPRASSGSLSGLEHEDSGYFESKGQDGDSMDGDAEHGHSVDEEIPSVGDPRSPSARIRRRARAGSEAGLLGLYRHRLLTFLQTSNLYNASTLLSRFPPDDLFEERALLLEKLGQHMAALQVYAHDLKDDSMAEAYCDRVYRSGEPGCQGVYVLLLRAYLAGPARHDDGFGRKPDSRLLSPEEEEERNEALSVAMLIIADNFSRVSPVQVMELLPPTTPVHIVQEFVEAVVRQNSHRLRELQVLKQMLRIGYLQVASKAAVLKSQFVTVEAGQRCAVCERPLGTAVVVYPNYQVVHIACGKSRTQCPVTHQVFSLPSPTSRASTPPVPEPDGEEPEAERFHSVPFTMGPWGGV